MTFLLKIGNIPHNFLVPRMIEWAPQDFQDTEWYGEQNRPPDWDRIKQAPENLGMTAVVPVAPVVE